MKGKGHSVRRENKALAQILFKRAQKNSNRLTKKKKISGYRIILGLKHGKNLNKTKKLL